MASSLTVAGHLTKINADNVGRLAINVDKTKLIDTRISKQEEIK